MRVPLRVHAAPMLALAAAAIILACGTTTNVRAVPTNPNLTFTPAEIKLALEDSVCNRSDPQLALDRGLDSNAVNFARANGYFTWCIPEYDDDQRLADANNGNNDDYGPVAHVLAAPWLDSLTITQNYAQVAIVEIDPDTTANPRPSPYKELRLDGQFNCLYLKYALPAGRGGGGRGGVADPSLTYDALIVAPGADLKCPIAPAASAGALPLVVYVDHQQVANDSLEIPATTRFVEGQGKRTLIGVKCGNHWCMVGPPGSGAPIPLSAHANVATMTTTAQGRVKGWFDDQVVGLPDNNGKYKIHRHYRASAVPADNLGALKVAQFLVDSGTQSYQPVGNVYFETPPDPLSKYATQFGFTQGPNAVGLRAEIRTVSGVQKLFWYARVTNANGQKNDIPTHRMDHSTYLTKLYGDHAGIPATMRWRWFDKDEDLWVECDLGCCLVGHGS
jgi:hypothetical protein